MNTSHLHIRIPAELLEAAQLVATSYSTTVSDLVRTQLEAITAGSPAYHHEAVAKIVEGIRQAAESNPLPLPGVAAEVAAWVAEQVQEAMGPASAVCARLARDAALVASQSRAELSTAHALASRLDAAERALGAAGEALVEVRRGLGL